MNKNILLIAFRNVMKNKRRSLLNILTFSVSVLTVLMGFGMLKGQFDAMFEKMIDLKAGHIKIYNKGFPAEKRTLPLDLNIQDPYKVIEAIKGAPHFKAASPRIIHPGIVSNGKKKVDVIIQGVDVAAEKNIVTVFNAIDGAAPSGASAEAMPGRKLSDILGLKNGDPLLLYSQTVNNANNLTDAVVTGTYEVGFDAMEKVDFYVTYAFAEGFFDMKGRATEIIVRLDGTENVAAAKKYIMAALEKDYPSLVALDWKEENPELIETADLKYKNFTFMAMILLFLSFFIILNTMTMSVFERVPEIGTLRAIGLHKGGVLALFLSEGLILSVFGALVGFVITAPMVIYMNVYGIHLDPQLYSGYNLPMSADFKAMSRFSDYIYAAVICVSAGVLGALIPSMRAAGVNIVSALKKGVR